MSNLPSASCSSNVSEEHDSQWLTEFRCPQCSFIGCNNASLSSHMVHHITRSSFQCLLCSFSVTTKNALVRHMNRFHPEHKTLRYDLKKKVTMPKKIRQPSIVYTVIQQPANFEVPMMMPATISPQVEIAEEGSNERGAHHVENQEFADQEIMAIGEYDINNTCCLSSGEDQGSTNQSSTVQCDECPLRHMAKLLQAIDTFNSQVYHGEDYDPVDGTEEMNCRKELNQLVEDIRAFRAELVQASNDMEAEARQVLMDRATREEDIRQRMESLKIAEQGLSNELAGLIEQRKSMQKKATEKTELKIKTERELFQLNFSSGNTSMNHQEASDSSLENNEKKAIQKMEKSVFKLKNKLEEIGKQERNLNESIQTTVRKLEETDRNLVELLKERELLRALPTSPSPTAVRVKALKGELRERVNRIVYLEEHLVDLHSQRIITDIRQKRKEWFESYDCHDDAEA